jgi:choline dehydrogenase-like flavoprotein
MTVERNPQFWWPGLTARRNPVQEPYRYLRGRGMGGSSTVNGLCAIRGVPADYDGWAARGAKGWSFTEVLPAFIALEDEHDFPDAPYHGAGGPVPVYREPEDGWGGADLAFRDAAVDAEFPWAGDHNAPEATGVSPFAMNISGGRRVSTNDGYLEPARDRPNLTIRGDCHAATLTFAAPSAGPAAFTGEPTVTGVQLTSGEHVQVAAGGEVIVACGAAHSPALLMRSGIGPAADLAALGIDVVADLPVGRRLQDHAMLLIPVRVRPDMRPARENRVTNCILRYSSGLGGAGENDMMLLPNNGMTTPAGPADLARPAVPRQAFMIVQQEQVFSRGRLTLPSADPEADPLIEQRLLTDPRDLDRMVDAVDRVGALLSHRAFSGPHGILDGRPGLPSRQDLPAVITDTAHLCGTCPMGSPDDDGTVVDPDCRVLGAGGLRVIDASVMPAAPRANLHLTVVMIAEHMAARMRSEAS